VFGIDELESLRHVDAVFHNSIDGYFLRNIDGDAMVHINGVRPDVVEVSEGHPDDAHLPRAEHEGWRGEMLRSPVCAIYEVETESTTTVERVREKWMHWMNAGFELNVVVPYAKVAEARRILAELEVDVSVWAYRLDAKRGVTLTCPTGLECDEDLRRRA